MSRSSCLSLFACACLWSVLTPAASACIWRIEPSACAPLAGDLDRVARREVACVAASFCCDCCPQPPEPGEGPQRGAAPDETQEPGLDTAGPTLNCVGNRESRCDNQRRRKYDVRVTGTFGINWWILQGEIEIQAGYEEEETTTAGCTVNCAPCHVERCEVGFRGECTMWNRVHICDGRPYGARLITDTITVVRWVGYSDSWGYECIPVP